MKIISKFKDFYDSTSHKYLDKQVIYKRVSVKIPIKRDNDLPEVYSTFVSTSNRSYYFHAEVLGFCGTLYPVVTISESSSEDNVTNPRKEDVSFYDAADLEKYVRENNIPMDMKAEFRPGRYYFAGHQLGRYTYFLNSKDKLEKLYKVFLKHETPVFILRKDRNSNDYFLFTNPMLKNYSFFKIMDQFSVHQEIYRYITSILPQPERPMVKISDEDKIHKHGFDNWSFRKLPSKKKKKAKK